RSYRIWAAARPSRPERCSWPARRPAVWMPATLARYGLQPHSAGASPHDLEVTMDRFTRFKLLRALWARAKNLLAWLHGPRERDAHLRAHRWLQINVAERQLRDGMIRGTGDPDSDLRPQANDRPGQSDAAWQAQWQ